MVGLRVFSLGLGPYLRFFLTLCFVFTAGPFHLEAQQGRGTISGTVTDSSGAAVPEASVTITNVRTNAVFTTHTNEEGFYTAPGLAVGEYVVSAERQGFKRAVHKELRCRWTKRRRSIWPWTSAR